MSLEFKHIPVMSEDIDKILTPYKSGVYIDCTFGGGSITRQILSKKNTKLISIDRDNFVETFSKEISKEYNNRFEFIIDRFSNLENILKERNLQKVPVAIIFDLGLSSFQIDNPERGFSNKVECPLDLRLNPKSGKSAAQFLKTVSQQELEELLVENADEPHYKPIARTIMTKLAKGMIIATTTDLIEVITEALELLPQNNRKEEIKKSCMRCFQALRIAVNDEFGALEKFLEKLPDVLAPGGRVAILSFHSGEDRRVKKSFQNLFRAGIYSEVAPAPILPSADECYANRRSRSAKLRWAIKA